MGARPAFLDFPGPLAFAHRLPVHAWTVHARALMESLLDLGVDGIITDQTIVLREVLTARGQWHPRHPA